MLNKVYVLVIFCQHGTSKLANNRNIKSLFTTNSRYFITYTSLLYHQSRFESFTFTKIMIFTLNRKSFLCDGPLSWTSSYFGAPHFLLLHSSPRADTGCFPVNHRLRIIKRRNISYHFCHS